jgi:hypothetical protein
MFDEPKEDPAEKSFTPAEQAKEKSDEFRMHAEIAAVFEGTRKFDARLSPDLSMEMARDIQRAMAKFEKARLPDTPVLPENFSADVTRVLSLNDSAKLSLNDYHVHHRPGETMIVRWLAGDGVDSYYQRLQAHFDAALTGYRDEERHAKAWKRDPQTLAYLEALDAIDVKMSDRYLRQIIKENKIFVLSTQTYDEFNIGYLADYIMDVPVGKIVGDRSAPPEDAGEAAAEADLTWFFKLFALRGIVDGVERMCFFTFLQKSDDSFGE